MRSDIALLATTPTVTLKTAGLSLLVAGLIISALTYAWVKWQLVSNQKPIASGSSDDRGAAYSQNLIERHMGRFDAQRGKEYRLNFDVLQDGSRLVAAHPMLRVAPNLNGYEGWLLLNAFAFYAGLACAAIGVVMVYRSRFGA